jgi:hypothetical protein
MSRWNILLPIHKEENDTMMLSASDLTQTFGREIPMDGGVRVPEVLQKAELGLQYYRQLEDGKSWVIRFLGGFSGDSEINDRSQSLYSFSGHYAFPSSTNSDDIWAITLLYGNSSPLSSTIPIPGLLYFFKRGFLSGVVGFPFLSLSYQYNEYSFSMQWIGTSVSLEAAQGNPREGQIYAGWSWSQNTYILQQRVQDKDRLTADEKKAVIGIRKPLLPFLRADLQAGLSYDRSVFVGQGSFNRDRGSQNIDRESFIQASLRMFY